MAFYSLSLNTTVTTNAAACGDLKAGANNSPRIMEICLNLITATASTYSFGRAGNIPTQTAPVSALPDNPNEPVGFSSCAVAWAPTAPTIPSAFVRRSSLPATGGAGMIWSFPRGFIVGAGSDVVLWNPSGGANSASMNFWFVVDE